MTRGEMEAWPTSISPAMHPSRKEAVRRYSSLERQFHRFEPCTERELGMTYTPIREAVAEAVASLKQ